MGWGKNNYSPRSVGKRRCKFTSVSYKNRTKIFFRIKVKTTIIRSSHSKPKTALQTKPWEIHCLMGGRMMTLCKEILPLISVPNEPVSITAGMNWRPLLTVNTNRSQDKMVETRFHRSRNLV